MNTPLKKNLLFLVALLGSSFIVFRPIKVLVDSEATYTLYASEITSEAPVGDKTTVDTPKVPEDIVGYIKYKFGDDASKALLVLQGDGTPGSCSENKALNPHATNDNRTWGGVGVDRGYWQINDVYHPHVSDSCAADVKCSTDYAFRMYINDNKSFRRWTCGRAHGV